MTIVTRGSRSKSVQDRADGLGERDVVGPGSDRREGPVEIKPEHYLPGLVDTLGDLGQLFQQVRGHHKSSDSSAISRWDTPAGNDFQRILSCRSLVREWRVGHNQSTRTQRENSGLPP